MTSVTYSWQTTNSVHEVDTIFNNFLSSFCCNFDFYIVVGNLNFTQFDLAGLLNPSLLDDQSQIIDTLNQAANELGLDQQLLDILDLSTEQQDIIEQYCQNVSTSLAKKFGENRKLSYGYTAYSS